MRFKILAILLFLSLNLEAKIKADRVILGEPIEVTIEKNKIIPKVNYD